MSAFYNSFFCYYKLLISSNHWSSYHSLTLAFSYSMQTWTAVIFIVCFQECISQEALLNMIHRKPSINVKSRGLKWVETKCYTKKLKTHSLIGRPMCFEIRQFESHVAPRIYLCPITSRINLRWRFNNKFNKFYICHHATWLVIIKSKVRNIWVKSRNNPMKSWTDFSLPDKVTWTDIIRHCEKSLRGERFTEQVLL